VGKKVEHSNKWLKVHRNPWNDVLNHWRITFNYRRKSIRNNKGGKVNFLLEEWPILKQPNGFILIESDFDDMKLTENVITKEIWDKFLKNICTIQRYNDRDANAVCLNDWLGLDYLSDDSRFVLQTFLLSHYVPPKGRMLVGKKHLKFSIMECKNSMIIHVT
ncbi:hypothetical protein PV327_011464, partial [Microctonus hyperodae]